MEDKQLIVIGIIWLVYIIYVYSKDIANLLNKRTIIFLVTIAIVGVLRYVLDVKISDYISKTKLFYVVLFIFMFYFAYKIDGISDIFNTRINSLEGEIQDVKKSYEITGKNVEQIQEKIFNLKDDFEEIQAIVKEKQTIADKEEIEKHNKISSFICTVSFEIDVVDFLPNEMRLAGYDPNKDFDFEEHCGVRQFQHIKDFISKLEFVSIGGNICNSWRPTEHFASGNILYRWPRFKDGVIQNKFPNKYDSSFSSMLFRDKYFIEVGVRGGKIQFLQFDMNENAQYDKLKVIGTFPYFDFIRELISLHEKVIAETPTATDKIKYEKEILTKSNLKDWELEERPEVNWGGKSFYGFYAERPLHDFRFKSAYAWISLKFEPNTRL